MQLFLAAVAILILLSGCLPSNYRYDDFSEVKRLLLDKIYYDHRVTFYCGCRFSKEKRVRCKVGEGKRAKTVEWEHVVPASRFGKTFAEWQPARSWQCELPELVQKLSGLKCRKLSARQNAGSNSQEYRRMEADMYNLVPAIGLINLKRSNLPYGNVPGEKRNFGSCDFEVSAGVAEPAKEVRGDIARISYYMEDAYPGRVKLSATERKMLSGWAKADPVDSWECERSRRIFRLQGNANRFVVEACKEAKL